MTITGILSPKNIPKNQTLRVQAPKAGNWLADNYEISDYEVNTPLLDRVEDTYEFRNKQDNFVHTLRNLPLDLHCLDTRAGKVQVRHINGVSRLVDHVNKGSVRPMQPGMCWEFDELSDLRVDIPDPINYPITLAVRFRVPDLTGSHSLISFSRTSGSTRYLYIQTSTNQMFFGRRNTTLLVNSIAVISPNQWIDVIVTFNSTTSVTTWHRTYSGFWSSWTKQTFTGLTAVPFIEPPHRLFLGQLRTTSPTLYLDGFISRANYIPTVVSDPSNSFPIFTKTNNSKAISYVCETSGSILDISGNDYHAETGFINDLGSFYNQTGVNNVESLANEVGYTLSDGTVYSDASATTLIPSGVIISRLQSDPTKAAAYTSRNVRENLEFTGKVPKDPVVFGPCGDFNGSTDYLAAETRLSQGNIVKMSAGVLVNPDAFTSQDTILGEWTTSGGERIWQINVTSANWGVNLSTDGLGNDKDFSASMISGTWIHLAFTYDGTVGSGDLKLYENGSQIVATKNVDNTCNSLANSTNVFAIGAEGIAVGGFGHFNGQITNAVVDFNRVWTSEEISGLYNGTIPTGILASYPIVESASGIVHNVTSDTGHLFLNTTNVNAFWSTRQNARDYLIQNGARRVRAFDGVDDQVNIGGLSLSVNSISMRLLCVNDNQALFTLDNTTGTSALVSAGSLLFGGSLNVSNLKIDGENKTASQAGALLNDQTWHTLTFNTNLTATNIRIGTDSSSFGQFYCSSFNAGDSQWNLTDTGTFAIDVNGNNGNYSGTTQVLVPRSIAGPQSEGPNKLISGVMYLELADEPFSPYGVNLSGTRGSTIYNPGDDSDGNEPNISVFSRLSNNQDDRIIVATNLNTTDQTKVNNYT